MSRVRGLAIGLGLIAGLLPAPARSDVRAQRPAPTVEMLDLLARAGQAFTARRFASAARLYRQAWSLDPREGQPLVMAGVAAYQSQSTAIARRDLRRALRGELSPEDRELALEYLGLIADERPGDAAPSEPDTGAGWSMSLATSVGGGYDSNARQARRGLLDADDPSVASGTSSMFASAGVELGCDFAVDRRTDVELGLGVEQSVYPDRTLADLDFQEHALGLAVVHRLRPDLRLRLQASSDLSFSGAGADLRPFQSSFRLEPQVAVGAGSARLKVGAAWQAISTQEPTLAHLSGHRLELTVTPILSIEGWLASLAGRVRHSALGKQWTEVAPSEDPLCGACGGRTVVSHSHDALGATFLLSSPFRWPVRPQIWARWDLRLYDQDQALEEQGAFDLERHDGRLRRDEHLAVGASVALRVGRGTTLSLRHERSGFSSTLSPATLGPACSAEACGVAERRGYRKQGLTLDLTIEWL